jgi:hypothetical protein
MKGGGRAPPPSPAWANFTLMMECTPESNRCLSVYSVFQATRYARRRCWRGRGEEGRSPPPAPPWRRYEPAAWSPATTGPSPPPASATCRPRAAVAEPAHNTRRSPACAGTVLLPRTRRCATPRRGRARAWTVTCPVLRTALCPAGRAGRPAPGCAVRGWEEEEEGATCHISSCNSIAHGFRYASATGPSSLLRAEMARYAS